MHHEAEETPLEA